MVVVIDYGMGNLYLVVKVFEYVGVGWVLVSSDVVVICEVDWVVFFGVGVICDCMVEICCLGFDVLVCEVS